MREELHTKEQITEEEAKKLEAWLEEAGLRMNEGTWAAALPN